MFCLRSAFVSHILKNVGYVIGGDHIKTKNSLHFIQYESHLFVFYVVRSVSFQRIECDYNFEHVTAAAVNIHEYMHAAYPMSDT